MVLKYLSVADNKIQGCLKIVIAIHNYYIVILRSCTNMVFL